jgi:hypothetical protein
MTGTACWTASARSYTPARLNPLPTRAIYGKYGEYKKNCSDHRRK